VNKARRKRPESGNLDRPVKAIALLALVALAIAFPQIWSNPAVTNYGVYGMIFVTVASAWNLFSGYSGYISIGQAVFFGSGAYAIGIAAQHWNLQGASALELLPFAGVIGAAIAVPFGLVALRVRRHTFIVITIAFFFIFQLMAYNLRGLTNGVTGLNAPFITWGPVAFNRNFYYIALAFAVATIVIAVIIGKMRFGLQLRAIRDDEDRARGLGVRTMRVKLTAFIISGAITAMIGAVWFMYLGQVLPNTGFDPLFDLMVVLMAFFGGYGSVSGPVLGALVIEPGTLWLNTQPSLSGISEILLGGVFLVIVLFVPRGVIPTGAEYLTKLRTRGRPAVVPATTIGPAAAAGATAASSVSSRSTGGAR
jgi:branched-chain amino acid transport system permease protein